MLSSGISKQEDGLSKDLDDNIGFVTLAASDDDEVSWEYKSLQNGLFTYYIVEGFPEAADADMDEQLSMEELFTYAYPRVVSYNPSQHPQMKDNHPGEFEIFHAEDVFPAAPTGLVAVAYSDSVVLSWNANTEPDLMRYRIYRSASPLTLLDSTAVGDTTYTDTAVITGQIYAYAVTAVDSAWNESASSDTLEAGGLSGIVTDQKTGLPIKDAVVQAWDRYPDGSVVASDTTDGSGVYALSVDAGMYDVRAYAYEYEGDVVWAYYSEVEADVSAPAEDVDFVLEPVPEVTGTTHVCDYFGENATFEGYPLQLGDVVQAMDPNGVLCGRTVVWYDVGHYAMHVIGDDPDSPEDEGGEPGDRIDFFLNNVYPDTSVAPLWAESGSWLYCPDFRGSTLQEIPLDAGWNLFSFHVDPPNDSLEVMLDPLLEDHYDYVGGYVTGQWDTWKRGRPPFANDLKVLSWRQGYWINMSEADTLMVSGMPVAADAPIPVDADWNLVSYLPLQSDSLEHALTSLDDLYDYVGGYVNGQWDTWKRGRPSFANDLKVLCPGQGYWLNMDVADILIYPTEGYRVESIAKVVAFGEGGSVPEVTATRWIADFWGWNEKSWVEGRPLRVGDVITVTDPDGVLCGATVVSDELGYLVHVYGDESTATPGVDEGAEEGDGLTFYVNGCKAQVVSGRAVWTLWRSEELALEALRASPEALIPERSALGQNRPNPFNAITEIAYDLSQRGKVRLRVYNVSGQLVRTLVDQVQSAGRYTAVWDGRDAEGEAVASGLYFYRLEVSDFTYTRKLVLLQ